MSAETVYRTRYKTNGRRVYHTDRSCPNLQHSDTVREVPLDSLWSDTTECEWCQGVGHRPDGNPDAWTLTCVCGGPLSPGGTCEWCEKAEELGIV